MSRRSRHSRRFGASKALIDMNSLIDLTFLLLVTFMVTLPAIQHGVEIMLPRAKAEEVKQDDVEDKPHVIDIQKVQREDKKNGYAVYLDNEKVVTVFEDVPEGEERKSLEEGIGKRLEGMVTEANANGKETVLEELERRLKDMVEAAQMSEKEVRVHVRGDKTLDYDTMMKVVAVVHRSKVHKMGLLTEGK